MHIEYRSPFYLGVFNSNNVERDSNERLPYSNNWHARKGEMMNHYPTPNTQVGELG